MKNIPFYVAMNMLYAHNFFKCYIFLEMEIKINNCVLKFFT